MMTASTYPWNTWRPTSHCLKMFSQNERTMLRNPLDLNFPRIKGKPVVMHHRTEYESPRLKMISSVDPNQEYTPSTFPWNTADAESGVLAHYLNGSESPCKQVCVKLNLDRPAGPVATVKDIRQRPAMRKTNNAIASGKPTTNSSDTNWTKSATSQNGLRSTTGASQAKKSRVSGMTNIPTIEELQELCGWPVPPTAPDYPTPLPPKDKMKPNKTSANSELVQRFPGRRTCGRKRTKSHDSSLRTKVDNSGQWHRGEKNITQNRFGRGVFEYRIKSPAGAHISRSGRNVSLYRNEGKKLLGNRAGAKSGQKKSLKPRDIEHKTPNNTRTSFGGSSSHSVDSIFSKAEGSPDHSQAFELFKKMTRINSDTILEYDLHSEGTSVDSGKRSPKLKSHSQSTRMEDTGQEVSSSVDPAKYTDLRYRIRRSRLSPEGQSSISDGHLDVSWPHGLIRTGKQTFDIGASPGFSRTPEVGHYQFSNAIKLPEYMIPYVTYRDGFSPYGGGTKHGSGMNSSDIQSSTDVQKHYSPSASMTSGSTVQRNRAHGMPPKQMKQRQAFNSPLQKTVETKSASMVNTSGGAAMNRRELFVELPTYSPPQETMSLPSSRYSVSPPFDPIKSKLHSKAGSPYWKEAMMSDPITQMAMMERIKPEWRPSSPETEADNDSSSQAAQTRDMAYLTYAITGERAKFPGDVVEVVRYDREPSPRAQSETDTACSYASQKSDDTGSPRKRGSRRNTIVHYLYDQNGHRTQKIVTYKRCGPKPRPVPPGRQITITRSPYEIATLLHRIASAGSRRGYRRSRKKRAQRLGKRGSGCRQRKGSQSDQQMDRTNVKKDVRKFSLIEDCRDILGKCSRQLQNRNRACATELKTSAKTSTLDLLPKSASDISNLAKLYRSQKMLQTTKMKMKENSDKLDISKPQSQIEGSRRHRRKKNPKRNRRKKRKKLDKTASGESVTIDIDSTVYPLNKFSTEPGPQGDTVLHSMARVLDPGVYENIALGTFQELEDLKSARIQSIADELLEHSVDTSKMSGYETDSRISSHRSGTKKTRRKRRRRSRRRVKRSRSREAHPAVSRRSRSMPQKFASVSSHRNRAPTTTASRSKTTRTSKLSRHQSDSTVTEPPKPAALWKTVSSPRSTRTDYSAVLPRIDTGLNRFNSSLPQSRVKLQATRSSTGPTVQHKHTGSDTATEQINRRTQSQDKTGEPKAQFDSNLTLQTKQQQWEPGAQLSACVISRPCPTLPPSCLRPSSSETPRTSEASLIERTARKVQFELRKKDSDNKRWRI